MESIIAASSIKPPKKADSFLDTVKVNLSISTILLLGAVLQVGLMQLPIRPFYTVLPAIFLLLARFSQTLLITYGVLPNPYLKDIIPVKFTAQVRDLDGNFSGPGQEKIAVLILGAKSSHPLGIFAPGMMKLDEGLNTMHAELDNDKTQKSGFLGRTFLTRQDNNGASELVNLSYWRSIDDVHAYAHGPTHRKVWDWWNREVVGKYKHIGIMHEVYEADKGKFESVYAQFQPTMFASTTFLKKQEIVDGQAREKEEWVSPIFDASRMKMSTSNGRRGVSDKKEVEEWLSKRKYA